MPAKRQHRAAYDSPWKAAVERLFPHFLAFFFAELHAQIDWSRPHKFLAQELEQISAGVEGELRAAQQQPGYQKGQRVPLRVDLLVEVYFKDGRRGRILLHIEIQNEPEVLFDERLFVYHYRIFDKTRESVITLALLTDFDAAWRPGRYERELAGCRVLFEFPVRKLLDYNAEELAASDNPFAFIAQAHLQARATSGNAQRRYDLRMVLQDEVEASELQRRERLLVARFIEDVMRLPAELDSKFFQERQERKKEQTMIYTTYAERVGERRGRRKGLAKGREEGHAEGRAKGIAESRQADILRLLEMRFSEVSEQLRERVANVSDPAKLDELFTLAFQCRSLRQFALHLPKLPKSKSVK